MMIIKRRALSLNIKMVRSASWFKASDHDKKIDTTFIDQIEDFNFDTEHFSQLSI